MSGEQKFTQAEAHWHFARQFNGQAWDLLEKIDRTPADNELMIHSAHASCRHWLEAGTGAHHQRGEWLISRVYAVLGLGEAALRHANRCLKLTETHADLLADFDRAFAYECMARAHATAGNAEDAKTYIDLAGQAGQSIADREDKKIFIDDFNGGNWFGLK